MPRSYDAREQPGGPPISGTRKQALRGPGRTGPIGAITPGDDIEVAREIARLWLELRELRRRATGEEVVAGKLKGTINTAASGATTLIAAVSGRGIKIITIGVVVDAAVDVTFEDSDGTDLSGNYGFPANGGIQKNYHPDGHYETAAGKGFQINLSAAVQASGDFTYDLV